MHTMILKPSGSSTDLITSWLMWSSSTDMMTTCASACCFSSACCIVIDGPLGTGWRTAASISAPFDALGLSAGPLSGGAEGGVCRGTHFSGSGGKPADPTGPSHDHGVERTSFAEAVCCRTKPSPPKSRSSCCFADLALAAMAAPVAGGPLAGFGWKGRETVKVDPSPCRLLMASSPLCRRTTSRTMARPMPMPSCLRASEGSSCWKGSSMRSMCCAAMPQPVSWTEMLIPGGCLTFSA
mmetsp:Transcript_78750/g.220308  ORF Transcript_78750/g.220308 Transcript_78750/m.220308 type:complete len:239 (-) Transcript_78750:1210-1926(-)